MMGLLLCASTEHIPIVRGLRAQETTRPPSPLLRLTPPEPLCYSLAHMKTHRLRAASA